MGATENLARHIVETTYESLPPEAVRAAKAAILDGVGVMLAGARFEQPPRIAAEYARDMGGKEQCSVFGFGFKTSPVQAALVNGISGHVLDYEPMWHPATHATSPTLPSILALAEQGRLSGKDVITALVVAFETQGRLRLGAWPIEREGRANFFHPPGTVGPFGAAAAGCKLLGLDVQRTRWALGLAGSRTGALSANIGTMTKSSHCGNAGRLGLEAALLAQKGYDANENILETPTGWVEALYGRGARFDYAALDAWGKPYRMVDPGLATKKHPAQFGTQRGIDCAIEIRQKTNVSPDDIAEVTIIGPVMEYINRPFPRTGLEGKFSYQYTVAVGLLDGIARVDAFTEERRYAPDMEALLKKIQMRPDPSIPPNFDEMHVTVQVRTRDGKVHEARVDKPRGLWGLPLTEEERATKFRNTAAYVLKPDQVEPARRMLERLEEQEDLTPLFDMMRG